MRKLVAEQVADLVALEVKVHPHLEIAAFAGGVLGDDQLRVFPADDHRVVGGVAGDHLERAFRIIGDYAALVPCLRNSA
jgi:hypothetical protein